MCRVTILGVACVLMTCAAWLFVVPNGKLTPRLNDIPSVESSGQVRITRSAPAVSDSDHRVANATNIRAADHNQRPANTTSNIATDLGSEAAYTQRTDTVSISSARNILSISSQSVERTDATDAVALAETVPMSGTVRHSKAIELVTWQTGVDVEGNFAFSGQVAHSPLTGPVYSTAVMHLYNDQNRLLAMVPVEDFPRRVHTNVPRTFMLQTDINAADVQRYVFYINVSRAEEIASEDASRCPVSQRNTASSICTPPTF